MKNIENEAHAKQKWRDKLCGARSKQNQHKPCRQSAMKNGRCRLHGGKSTGPKTEEGRFRSACANFKHGNYSREAIEERKIIRKIMLWRKDL